MSSVVSVQPHEATPSAAARQTAFIGSLRGLKLR